MHKSPAALRLYVMRSEDQRINAAKKRFNHTRKRADGEQKGGK